jgi:hypothetical protein
MDIDLTQAPQDGTSVAETLAKYFHTLRLHNTDRGLPEWGDLTEEEQDERIAAAAEYLTPILAPLLDRPGPAGADDQARIHISNLLRRPDILPEDRAAAEEWLRSQPAPPGTLDAFEEEHGPVGGPDGEG